MASYINKLGDIYTQEELEAAALENGVDIDTIIVDNELTQEEPGKGKGATAKGSTVAQKKKRTLPSTKPVSSTRTSSSASTGENPFGKNITTFSEDVTSDYKAQQKEKPQPKQPKKQADIDPYAKAMQESMDYFTETRNREAAGLEPAPTPGSFGRKKFEQEEAVAVKKAQAEKKKAEDEKTKFGAKIAELDLKYSPEASAAHKEAMAASELTNDENSYLDGIIKTELSKNGVKRPSVTSYDEYGNPISDIADEKPYVAFEKQRKNVIKRLKADGVLDKYDEKQIAEEAAALWRDQEINKIKTDKYTRHLKENKKLSEEAQLVIDNYGIKKVKAEDLEVMESSIARNRLVGEQEDIAKQISNIDSKLKPKDYNFKTQSEVDQQNALITERNELVGYYVNNEKLDKTLSETISTKGKNVKDLSLAYDMLKRDYSTLGYIKERGIKLKQWANEFLLAGSYLADVGINAATPGDGPFKMNPITEALADNANKYSDALNNSFSKDIQGTQTIGEILSYTGDLTLDFAPDLIAMIYTGGTSTAAKGAAKEVVKKGLLSKVGSALTISKETAPITARVIGGKYGQMVNEQRFGYYDEGGNKIMPNYSSTQMMLVPSAYGYMEGLGEKATAGIIKRNAGFWKLAKEADPVAWGNFGMAFTRLFEEQGLKSYLKKAGKDIVKGQIEEQPAEFLTYVGQDLADKFLLGKEVNLLENTGQVFKDTGLLTIALTGMPVVGGLLVKPFMSQTTSQKLETGAVKLAEIKSKLLQTDLTEMQRVALEKQEAAINSEMQSTISNTLDNINDMPAEVYNSVNASASKVAAVINKAKEIADSEMDPENKKADLDILWKEYQKESFVLNTLTRNIESVNTFGKPINSITRGEIIGLQAERVATSFNDSLSKVQRDDANAKIDKQIEAIYASNDVNINEERTKEYEQNLKVAQKLATSSNVLIIEGNNKEDLLARAELRFENKEISEADLADLNAMIEGEAEGGFSDSGNVLFIQKDLAVKRKAVTVGSHEFLHKLLQKTMQNATTQINLGRALADYLIKTNPELYLNDKVVGRQYGNYDPKDTGKFNEELLTIFSDALLKGEVKYNESVFTKLGDIIRRFFQDLGVSNIEFNSGVDVYNFIKDYNNTISKGKDLKGSLKKVLEKGAGGELVSKEGVVAQGSKLSKSIEDRMDDLEDQLTSGEIDIDLYESRMKALEKEEAELKRKEYEEKKAEVKKPEAKPAEKKPVKAKEDAEVSDIANKAKAKLDAIGNDPKGFNPNNPVIYTELDKMVKAKSRNWKTAKGTIIDFTNKDKGGIDGFDLEQMTSYVTTSMIPYIAKFDPSRNNSLYGYINAQYINRMKGALKSGEVADVVFSEDVSEMTKLSNEEVEVKKPSLPERKRFQNILESGVFSPEVIEEIQKKILPVVRTLKSKIDEKVSLNRTVTPLIEEIRNEMGKQADIDIKKAMGGKEGGQLVKWLIANKKTILENAPTTWLMGKDNGKTVLGGMPFAIQKRVDGRWLNYPDWVGKKVDRESVDVDLAGRTAGHEMTRRLPDVNKNVPNDVFIESIIDPVTKGPLRGRKESLAKMMAEEVSFDIISDDIANDGIIAQALKKNQELLGAVVEKITVEEINRLVERGNVKFSLSSDDIINAFDYLMNEADGSHYNAIRSKDDNAYKKLWELLSTGGLTADELNMVFDKYKDVLEKISALRHEKMMTRFLAPAFKKYGVYIKGYGGYNNYTPDSVAGIVKNVNKNSANKVIIEFKKGTGARITSTLMNVLNTSYTDNAWAKDIKDAYNKFENSDLYNSLKDYLETKSDGISKTQAGYLKVKDADGLSKALRGKKVVGNVVLPAQSVIDINDKKAYKNDFLMLDTSFTDYFGNTFFENYDVDKNTAIRAEIQLKIERGSLIPRVYFYINKDAVVSINNKIKESSLNIFDVTDQIKIKINTKSIGKLSKSLETNLNSFKGINNIDLVSKYISDNNIKRISAEESFEVLNDLAKEIENYWGVVPDNIITLMDRSVDYAFDVIEDRENEGGSLMAAVNDALNLETIKNTEVQLNKFIDNNKIQTPKFSKSLDYEFNDMLERNKNVPSYEKISDIVAKRAGKKVTRLSFFVPPSADDFRGLTTYMFAGSGKQGELDQQFFDANLVIPYVKGVNALDSVRQSIKKEYKKLLDSFPDIKGKLEKLTPDKQFTYDQAIRVYLWQKNDIEVPGLSRTDKNKLVFFVKKNSDLMDFANALSLAGRQDGGWMKPSVTWDSDTIISDLHNITEGEGRKKWLSEFIENANAIFTPENLNKVQFIYGTDVRNQIEDSLYRMKNGKSRPEGTDAITNKWMNWINGSTAAIMFFNVRSALLQTISSTNYLNWNDNNPIAAAAAFADQKQYWADFATIINSDKMRERRSGLKSDVTQAEIANAANSATDKAKGILSYLQKIGFTPTQAADSFSIAIGGASFYRNRVNTYLKQVDEDGNKINTLEEAEEKAWLDFSVITDQSMQSADPMYVSKQQTTALGRLVLAFANTPLQYNRQIKKATLDLVNKRGDWKTNVSKIVYYGALQNLLFSALQSALFLPFDDEDEEAIAKMSKDEKKAYDKLVKKQEDKTKNILNGMLDTVLRGSGVYGALVSTIKNVGMEYQKQEERKNFADHAQTLLALSSISPPISSKARKLYGIHRTSKFEKDVIEKRGWEVTSNGKLNLSPKYTMVGNAVMATTNVPLDRIVEKVENISEVLDNRNTVVQRTALFLGWKEWELNVKNEENEKIKTAAKEKRKEEGIEKAVETRKAKKEAEKEAYKRMSTEEKFQYNRKKAKEKTGKRIERRKKKIEEIKAEVAKRKSKRKMG